MKITEKMTLFELILAGSFFSIGGFLLDTKTFSGVLFISAAVILDVHVLNVYDNKLSNTNRQLKQGLEKLRKIKKDTIQIGDEVKKDKEKIEFLVTLTDSEKDPLFT